MKLSDIIQLHYGKSLPSRDRNDGKVPVYGSGGITGYHDQALIDGPGIIVGRKGSIGTIYFEDKDFFPIDTVFYVEHDEEKIDQEYLYFYLKEMNLENMNTDAAVPGLNRDVALSQEVSIPDLTTQQKIASILSAFDDLIENNTRRIEILEEMARRIYREWFVHFRYPGHEDDELVDSGTELGEIPEGWEVKKLKDFLKFKNGKSPETKEGEEYPVYGSNGIIGKCNEPGWEDGIIIGRVGAYCGSVEYCEGKFWGSDNTIVATTREEYDFPLYAYYKLEDLNLRRYAGGSAQPLMTQTVIKDIKVAIPSNELLEQFCKQARDLWKLKRNLEKQNKKLKETRDLLLPKLISGKIDVEEIELAI